MKYWTPEEIKDLRLRKRLTQERFAKLIGVSLSSVHNWERGLKHPQLTILGKLDIEDWQEQATAAKPRL